MSARYTNLQLRRIGAYCLNEMTNHLKLGSKAIRFNSEDRKSWEIPTDWQIFYLRGSRRVAEVYLIDDKADIVIPNWDYIIRDEHYGDFFPHEHNISYNHNYDSLGIDKEPDGMVFGFEYNPDKIPLWHAPEQLQPQQTGTRPFRVIVSR